MTPIEVGKRLVAFCRANQHLEAIDALYAADVVSVEPRATPAFPEPARGIDAVRAKNRTWIANYECHSGSVSGPFVHGDRFTCVFRYEATRRVAPDAGRRVEVVEVGLYTVADGRIVREEFFGAAE